MVTFTPSTPATAGEKLLITLETALARVAGMWRAARNRRSVAKLLNWDEHMLRDIGLTSGDVRSVMALPANQDPSQRLGVLSVERRAAHRAAMREQLARADVRVPIPSKRTDFRPFLDL